MRVVLVFNTKSSRAGLVYSQIIEPLEKAEDIELVKFQVGGKSFDANVEALSKLIEDGDVVVTAGGDGTTSVGVNGVMNSEAKVRFMALPYGNFNDVARAIRKMRTKEFYPLDVHVNNEHFRFAASYVTIGMLAECAREFEEPSVRGKLRGKKFPVLRGLVIAFLWYLRNRKKYVLPRYKQFCDKDGFEVRSASDYSAVNGPYVAGFMRGGKYFLDSEVFLSSRWKFQNFFLMVISVVPAILFRLPGRKSKHDLLIFNRGDSVGMQIEGEYVRLKDVNYISVRKAKKPLQIF